MKLVCTHSRRNGIGAPADVNVDLYRHKSRRGHGNAGAAIVDRIRKNKLEPSARAWDLLSLALSVIAADLAGHRSKSADGWTRQFELDVAVSDADFWNSQKKLIANFLAFLTTDTWQVRFVPGGFVQEKHKDVEFPKEDCVALLSGGLDSLTGAIDLVALGRRPFAVSQTVRGDGEKQLFFAQQLDGGLRHLQLNRNVEIPNPEDPPSQRARSIGFLAYGVLAATSLDRYREGHDITLYVCENGFISINPPLTGARVGSLSARTTHPVFFAQFQALLDAAALHVRLENPYRLLTKGEMLRTCSNQDLLRKLAHTSTSCGRFKQFGYKHCGRCVPCLVRRAAFLEWGVADLTKYHHQDLSVDDTERVRFDDVRSVMMALAEVKDIGIDHWLSAALSSPLITDADATVLRTMVQHGLSEVGRFLTRSGVQ